jgi:WD40 repeat protein
MAKIEVNKLYTLTGHNDCIYALAEGSDPRFFYTGSGDGMVVEWDLDLPKNGKLIARLTNSVYALREDPARNWLFIGHNFEGIHVVDLNDNKEIWSLKLTDQAIFDIKIVDNYAYVGAADGVLTIVDIKKRAIKKHIKLSSKSIRSLAVATKKKHLAVGLSDNTIKILDFANEFQPVANITGHSNSVFALSYSPDEQILASGARDAKLKFWDSSNYTLSESIVAHLYAINYLSFNRNGDLLATCSMDKSIKVWDSVNRKLLKVIDKARNAGHGTSINKVVWSTYNGNVIAVSDDRTISIWQIQVNNS